jgi:Ca2+-transporting ATPase
MKPYFSSTIEQVIAELGSDAAGLDQQQAAQRLLQYGYNRLPEPKKLSIPVLFFRQYRNPLIYILFAALLISLLTAHWIDAIIIASVIYISSVIGFFQEYKAGQALERLQKLIRYDVNVLRNGRSQMVPHEQIVPGDVILLSSGDKIPADARLIEVNGFSVIEATLTGESLPVNKTCEPLPVETPLADRKNMVYAGTVVADGKARAIVTATGVNTELGQIATLVKSTREEQTPLQKQLFRFGKWLGLILVVINILIFLLGILTGVPLLQMFLTSVAVVVSAVPEGLIPAMTVILTVGMNKLVKNKGLVRKLVAAETLGSVSVICTDKTGTLTVGQMQVTHLISSQNVYDVRNFSNKLNTEVKQLLEIAIACNTGFIDEQNGELKVSGNPTDRALLLMGRQLGYLRHELLHRMPLVTEWPFSSEHKFMATEHRDATGHVLFVKGAPERILPLSAYHLNQDTIHSLDETTRERINRLYSEFTGNGYRVLALAFKRLPSVVNRIAAEDISELVFAGFVAMKDALRPEVKIAIRQCHDAGIRPVMVTGDNRLTAARIATEAGMDLKPDAIIDGHELDLLSDEMLARRLKHIQIFARVEPRHKSRIVSAYQQNGEVVAMTGDGVNDSPALKKADIGVAMGSGSDISRDVADLVLLDDNFSTIVEAVRRGRIIFDNIRKVTLYLLTDAFSTMIIVGGAVLLGAPLPLLPAQILWMKLTESVLPAMALAFDELDEGIMKLPPRKKEEPLISPAMKKLILSYALIMDSLLFLIFLYCWNTTGDLPYARTVTFVALGLNTYFYVFAVRGFRLPVYKINPFNNRFLLIALLLGISMVLIAIYVPLFNQLLQTVPLGLNEWKWLLGYAALSIVVYETGKQLTIARQQ